MSKITGKELAEQLGDFVNNFNCDEEEFINAFCRQHRTLQQSSFRLICKLIDRLSSDEYLTDGRNEGTAMVAKMLIEGFKTQVVEKEIAAGYTDEKARKFANTEYTRPANYLGHI